MQTMRKGDVVLVPFPFTDLSGVKVRPAVVAADLGGDDVILCQVTSRFRDDGYTIALSDSDFVEGKLDRDSLIRVNKVFTMDRRKIIVVIGKLSPSKRAEVCSKLVDIFNCG